MQPIATADRSNNGNTRMLPSGPTDPPVSQFGPFKDEFIKCPVATMPLFGTP
jgi:hypothetical protein